MLKLKDHEMRLDLFTTNLEEEINRLVRKAINDKKFEDMNKHPLDKMTVALEMREGAEPISKVLSKKADKDEVEKLVFIKADKTEIAELKRF